MVARLSAEQVVVPSAAQQSALGNDNTYRVHFWNRVQHAQQVLASGTYMIYRTLGSVIELMGSSDNFMGVVGMSIRAGQMEWMMGQMGRLKHVLRLSEKGVLQRNLHETRREKI